MIYPSDLDPETGIATALNIAETTGRRVLLNFGADWCKDSRAMYRRLTGDPDLSALLQERYEMVMIDVGERGGAKWNSPVVERYGRPFADHGIPALVVLGDDGSPLFRPSETPLRDSDHRHPKKLRRFLERWSKP